MDWWNNREENDQAWKVNVNDLKDWDLDIKNPIQEKEDELKSSEEIIEDLLKSFSSSVSLLQKLKTN